MRRDGQPFEEGWGKDSEGRWLPIGFFLKDMEARMSPERFASFQTWARGTTRALDINNLSIVYYHDYYDWLGGRPNYD